MNLLPVIERELRATSRRQATYWLRVGGAAAALFTILLFAWDAMQGSLQGGGAVVFALVHRVVFFSIWLGVPWLVADSISRERREGTLGLLFLTSLRPHEIVLAKTFVHSLRALTLWLAILPVMSLAFFLGGVGWREALLSVAVNLSALFLALAAGLLATALCRRWLRAMVFATCLSLVLMVFALALWGAACAVMWFAFIPVMRGGGVFFPGGSYQIPPSFASPGMSLPVGATISVAGMANPLADLAVRVGLAFGILVGALVLAAWRVRRSWQETPPPIWMQQVGDFFCRPRYFRRLLKSWMKRQIERNPIGWLEQRVWTSRLVVWSWFAVIVGLYSGIFSSPGIYMRIFEPVQVLLCSVLMLFVCTSAAGSFRRERETGVMELLLVSPISERRIIGGRLRALWGRFLPATALLALIWMIFPREFRNEAPWSGVLLLLSSFATLPVIGLYQSLRRQYFLTALLWTIALGILLPLLLPAITLVPYVILFLLGQAGYTSGSTGGLGTELRLAVSGCSQFWIAAACGYLLHRNLTQRRFALERNGEV